MPSVLKRKNITLVAAVLSIYVVDFAINAGTYSSTSVFIPMTDLLQLELAHAVLSLTLSLPTNNKQAQHGVS
jgi:hypothetical protein